MVGFRSLLAFALPACLAAAALPVANLATGVEKPDARALFSLDPVEGAFNTLVWRGLGRSPDASAVYPGGDGQVFLGDRQEATTRRARGLLRADPEAVRRHARDMLALQTGLAELGTALVVAVVPDKSSVERESLPGWMRPHRPLVTDQFMDGLRGAGVRVVDLRGPVRALRERQGGPVYGREDSHWTNAAAAVGYEAIMDALDGARDGAGRLPLRRPAYRIAAHHATVSGNGGLLKLWRLGPPENVGRIALNGAPVMCVRDYPDVASLEAAVAGRGDTNTAVCGPVAPVWINHRVVDVEVSGAANPDALLWLSDSFGANRSQELGNGPLVYASFARIWNWHFRHSDPQSVLAFARAHKPDAVVIQMVERSFPVWMPGAMQAMPQKALSR